MLGNLNKAREIKALAAELDAIGDEVREKGANPLNVTHVGALIEVYQKLGTLIGVGVE